MGLDRKAPLQATLLCMWLCVACVQEDQTRGTVTHEDEAAMSIDGQITLVQGNSWRGPDIDIGLSTVRWNEGQGQAQFIFFDKLGPHDWESDIELRRGAIFPVAGRFLQVAAISSGEEAQRDSVLLQPVADTGGIAAPNRAHALLIEGGKAKFGDTWVALTMTQDNTSVTLERWPLGRLYSRLSPDQLQTAILSPGEEIQSGSLRYRLVRIQPSAGDLLGFVEFSVAQP